MMQTAARRLRSLAATASVAAVAAATSTRTDARAESRVMTLRQFPRDHWPTSTSTSTNAATTTVWPKPQPLANVDLRQRYRVDSVIGRGGFGLVHEGRDKRSNARVAIKRVCKQTTSKAKFLQEVDILRAVGGHHHVLSLCDAFETTDAYVLVTELVDGEELFDHLMAHGVFDERPAMSLVRDVAQSLAYLHTHGVVHGDLKPENILVAPTANGLRVKLIDFGQSFREHVASERSRCVGSGVATIAYAAPEVLATATTTTSTSSTTPTADAAGSTIDMWGLGVVLYILLCGFHPFDAENDASDAQLAERIVSGVFDTDAPEWKALPSAARDLIEQLLQVDAAQRLSAEQVLSHPWLAQSVVAV